VLKVRRTKRASLMESWIAAMTLGVFSMGSPRGIPVAAEKQMHYGSTGLVSTWIASSLRNCRIESRSVSASMTNSKPCWMSS
jgi:hypothetical protein